MYARVTAATATIDRVVSTPVVIAPTAPTADSSAVTKKNMYSSEMRKT